jgi:hypothetical protein
MLLSRWCGWHWRLRLRWLKLIGRFVPACLNLTLCSCWLSGVLLNSCLWLSWNDLLLVCTLLFICNCLWTAEWTGHTCLLIVVLFWRLLLVFHCWHVTSTAFKRIIKGTFAQWFQWFCVIHTLLFCLFHHWPTQTLHYNLSLCSHRAFLHSLLVILYNLCVPRWRLLLVALHLLL